MSLIGRSRQMLLTCIVNINPTILGLIYSINKSLNKFSGFLNEKDTTIIKMVKIHTKKAYLVPRNYEMPVIKFALFLRTSWFRKT